MSCELCGCIYNDDGKCIYDTSSIKIECACACYNDDYPEEQGTELPEASGHRMGSYGKYLR